MTDPWGGKVRQSREATKMCLRRSKSRKMILSKDMFNAGNHYTYNHHYPSSINKFYIAIRLHDEMNIICLSLQAYLEAVHSA